jgi:hypothetical protein
MIQQPRVPPTGTRQAIEVHIKWREVLDYKREYLRVLSLGTGWTVDKLDAVGGWSMDGFGVTCFVVGTLPEGLEGWVAHGSVRLSL